MPNVYPAIPYCPGSLGSLDRTAYMLLRQENFPHTYSQQDKHTMADSDRLLDRDCGRTNECFRKHTGTGELGLESWIRKASPEACMDFLKDVLEADPKITWTGFRVMGSVHLGNGYPVWTLELFAKHPNSATEVYSGQDARNVRGFNPAQKEPRIRAAVSGW